MFINHLSIKTANIAGCIAPESTGKCAPLTRPAYKPSFCFSAKDFAGFYQCYCIRYILPVFPAAILT